MSKTKVISDEEIVSALISCATLRDTAEKVGMSERGLRDRMQDRDFKAVYLDAKAALIRRTVIEMNSRLGTALDTITSIMQNDTVRPETRLLAADKLLQYADRYAKRLSTDEHTASLANDTFHIDL